jgi:fructose-1,6-bisphosphatase
VKRVNVQVFWYMWTGAYVDMYGEVNVCTCEGRVVVHE